MKVNQNDVWNQGEMSATRAETGSEGREQILSRVMAARVTDNQLRHIRDFAAKEGMSVSQLVKEIVLDFVGKGC